ncbi:hypothetical protein DICSQDRAFT_79600 [Dichomitus squalens LYAD-421 SS1]|uniref:uncharacterized protein n=1 Tax=Dichomitus squalens (strain LYAD-421) TaxID=732165 RepID=UPI00044138D7|nr:uncharacterized protein DICSQDRAFT_79600 [Dichomitus squalens LYAD-421 SS1]EJF65436.1 hypothetical protein DICSQDRAFT_79600 [Dichomitus squalens LYAD-421 SS1]
MSSCILEPDVVTVEYEIAGASEHSGSYVAENILHDRPRDQTSRWSGAISASNTKQWIRLRLKNPCVLRSITFGKFYKTHPCNMKEFKVLIGLTEGNMTEVLQAGLKNDSTPETFSIKSTNRVGMPFPTKFIEVVPLSAHGQSFNTSIWHISLSGITDEAYVERIRLKHQEYRETVTLRQILKHLRQRRFLTPVNQILARSGLQLEHPLITSLHSAFVLNGAWAEAEKLIRDCADAGLLRGYRHACQTRMRWTQIRGLDPDGDVPCRRGGHAMCIDEDAGLIYLFGGWDGQRSLDDLWVYDIAKDVWKCLSVATSREKNGPGPRACHKMVFDSKTGSIYLLGRLSEGDGDGMENHRRHSMPEMRTEGHRDARPPWLHAAEVGADPPGLEPGAATIFGSAYPSQCSEFYRYHTRGLDAGNWDLLTFDTASSGGPPLVFDHQMAIDSDAQMIYVSGGRVHEGEGEMLKFSGLYSYDIRTSKWKMYNNTDVYASHPYIPPRWGHSMVLDPKSQTLFIFGGQRDDRYLSDMYAFHIPTSTVTEVFSNFTSAGGPDPCFTQRAVIDIEKQEVYVLCGLTRLRPTIPPVLETESPYWIYRYDRPELPGKWSKILPEKDAVDETCPHPRYAHQAVYDSKSGIVYMHGGNAGSIDEEESELAEPRPLSSDASVDAEAVAVAPGGLGDGDVERRLDDFWSMEILRPSNEEIVRRAVYEIRQQQFREMCEDGPPIKALTFLQTRVSSVVNHEDPDEAKVFRALLSAHLLAAPPRPATASGSGTSTPSSIDVSAAATATAARADSPPPRKRSRPSTPNPAALEAPSVGGPSVLRLDEDPAEEGGSPPSPERYRQRTAMFEQLLSFVNEDAKQPDLNLIDMLSTDGFII